MGGEQPDVIAFNSWYSMLVECKVSRADFLRDFKKEFRKDPDRGMWTYRFYCCPKGLITIDELPDKWGLIYINEKGKARCVHNPYQKTLNSSNIYRNGFKANVKAERFVMTAMLNKAYLKR